MKLFATAALALAIKVQEAPMDQNLFEQVDHDFVEIGLEKTVPKCDYIAKSWLIKKPYLRTMRYFWNAANKVVPGQTISVRTWC